MFSETCTNSGEETPTKKWVGWGLTFKTHTLMIMHKMTTPLIRSLFEPWEIYYVKLSIKNKVHDQSQLETLSLVYLLSWDHIIKSEPPHLQKGRFKPPYPLFSCYETGKNVQI